jgi:hypothetical protein
LSRRGRVEGGDGISKFRHRKMREFFERRRRRFFGEGGGGRSNGGKGSGRGGRTKGGDRGREDGCGCSSGGKRSGIRSGGSGRGRSRRGRKGTKGRMGSRGGGVGNGRNKVEEVIGGSDIGLGVNGDVFESNMGDLKAERRDAGSMVTEGILDDGSNDRGIEGSEVGRSVVATEMRDTKLKLELGGANGMGGVNIRLEARGGLEGTGGRASSASKGSVGIRRRGFPGDGKKGVGHGGERERRERGLLVLLLL